MCDKKTRSSRTSKIISLRGRSFRHFRHVLASMRMLIDSWRIFFKESSGLSLTEEISSSVSKKMSRIRVF